MSLKVDVGEGHEEIGITVNWDNYRLLAVPMSRST